MPADIAILAFFLFAPLVLFVSASLAINWYARREKEKERAQ